MEKFTLFKTDRHKKKMKQGHSQASLPSKEDRVIAKACRAHRGKL